MKQPVVFWVDHLQGDGVCAGREACIVCANVARRQSNPDALSHVVEAHSLWASFLTIWSIPLSTGRRGILGNSHRQWLSLDRPTKSVLQLLELHQILQLHPQPELKVVASDASTSGCVLVRPHEAVNVLVMPGLCWSRTNSPLLRRSGSRA
jgi:hypothetical protein